MSPEEFSTIIMEANFRSNRILDKAMADGRHFMTMLVISPCDPADGKKMIRAAHVAAIDDEDIAIIDSFAMKILEIQKKYAKRDGYEIAEELGDKGITVRSVRPEDPNKSEPSVN